MNSETGPMLSVEDVPVTCDICDEPQHDGEAGEDWDGESGTHFSCQTPAKYTGPVVNGPPIVQGELQCAALVRVRKGVYRRCHRTPEFSGSLANNRGYSQMVCFTHTKARTITFAVNPF